MTEQEVHEQHERDCRREAETRRLVQEVAHLSGKSIPFATHEWHDLHQRRHIAPWPEEPKHEVHSFKCWCGPALYRGVIIHWQEQKDD